MIHFLHFLSVTGGVSLVGYGLYQSYAMQISDALGHTFVFGDVGLCRNKNSSGDEIANVNLFTTISHTYFKTPKRKPSLYIV